MESAVLSSDVREQQMIVEPEDASEELFWWPSEPASGPLADTRFIL